MKRILLLVLGFLFMALWVAGLFYPARLNGIHLALIVALLFFIRSVMVVKPRVAKETADKTFITINQSFKKDPGEEIINEGKPEVQRAV